MLSVLNKYEAFFRADLREEYVVFGCREAAGAEGVENSSEATEGGGEESMEGGGGRGY